MNNFTPHRFFLLMKHEIIENGRGYLRFHLGVFATFFLVIFLVTYNLCLDPENEPNTNLHWIDSVVFTCLALTLALSMVSASYIFSNLSDKQGRIRFLMIPATNIEKFICRWLQFCVLGPIMLIVTFIAADVACWVLRAILGNGLGFATPDFLDSIVKILFVKTFWDVEIMVNTLNLSGFVNLCVFLATYMLGGALFRRVPYIFTTLAGIALFFIMVTLIMTLSSILFLQIQFESIGHWIDAHRWLVELFEYGEYLFWIIPLAWIAFCHWLSYRMFCRCNIITNKTLGL